MDLGPYVERLRGDLVDAAAAGDAQTHEVANRLALALDPAVRMTLLEALSDASAELTGELEDTSIEVRLRGREPQFVVERVDVPAGNEPPEEADVAGSTFDDELNDGDDTLARVTVRIPESLKTRAEDLAATGSQSLNSWIVQAIRFATRERAINVDIDLGSRPFGFPGFPGTSGAPPGPQPRTRRPRRVQGWSR